MASKYSMFLCSRASYIPHSLIKACNLIVYWHTTSSEEVAVNEARNDTKTPQSNPVTAQPSPSPSLINVSAPASPVIPSAATPVIPVVKSDSNITLVPLSELIKSSIQSLNVPAVANSQFKTPSGESIGVDAARTALEQFQEWYLVCSFSTFLEITNTNDFPLGVHYTWRSWWFDCGYRATFTYFGRPSIGCCEVGCWSGKLRPLDSFLFFAMNDSELPFSL